jgi:hypothetical protein
VAPTPIPSANTNAAAIVRLQNFITEQEVLYNRLVESKGSISKRLSIHRQLGEARTKLKLLQSGQSMKMDLDEPDVYQVSICVDKKRSATNQKPQGAEPISSSQAMTLEKFVNPLPTRPSPANVSVPLVKFEPYSVAAAASASPPVTSRNLEPRVKEEVGESLAAFNTTSAPVSGKIQPNVKPDLNSEVKNEPTMGGLEPPALPLLGAAAISQLDAPKFQSYLETMNSLISGSMITE